MKGKYRFLTILLGVLIMMFCFTPGIYVNAATDDYSDVLDDLKLNEDFDETNYLVYTLDEFNSVNSDGKPFNDVQFMSVITIAESSNKELYIYVYNPTYADLAIKARKISMSNEKREGYECNGLIIYDLELLSTNGVFQKYKLKNYTISSESERYYNFVSLYRDTSNDVDSIIDDTITNFASEKVGKQFVFYKLNGEYACEMQEFKTLEIDVKLTDHIYFKNGFSLKNLVGKFTKGYLFYIVFDIEEYIAERIIDADIKFSHRTVTESWGITVDYVYGEWIDEYYTLFETDVASYKPEGFFTSTVTWNRISKSNDFYESLTDQDVTFNDDVISTLLTSQWVFAFYESEYKIITSGGSSSGTSTYTYEEVEEIAILRIHFIDNRGEHYNLGVVGDITSPDNVAGGVGGGTDWDKLFKTLTDGFDTIFMLLGLVVLLVVIVAAFPIFKFVLDGLVLIICLPFKLIDFIFPKKKK